MPQHPSVQSGHFDTHPHRAKGFTLVELLCAVTLLGIVVTLAAPNFSALIQRMRVRQAVMELKGALYVARSEAVRRAEDIKLRKRDSAEGKNCTGTANDWSCGWIVFLDNDGDASYSETNTGEADELLRSFPAPIDTTVRFTSNASVLTVNRWGTINGVGAGFVVSPQSPGSSDFVITVCVSTGGRVRTVLDDHCS
ncbi:prepilin-type N-terminal cleavage/methylation domain-containing protein [Diaphorobacter sp. HDW4B]|uniref:GspH/FimT family pseudopilin n=1 Tax=Diaphorobacter sp. HDW4B TaxID=2714925 RepID=UPI00140D40B6|nr:GspH/FimT family pseudopilin [Diaphorobacter sp. HDW4B]QIL71348.1 prepilin-type N-terminal cleavage/methylation domain-containing protein [Diaphorobacter sp. HDW4B]